MACVEQARELHEDLEQYERAVCAVLEDEDDGDVDGAGLRRKGYKEKLVQSHKVRRLLDSMQERARKLVRKRNAGRLVEHALLSDRACDDSRC